MAEYDMKFKIVLFGHDCSGKTSLIDQYTQRRFRDCVHATIGLNFQNKEVKINGGMVLLNVWDTPAANIERWDSLRREFAYPNVDAIVVVYDITNRDSFSLVSKLIKEANDCTNRPDLPKLLIGNKIDLEKGRVVDHMEAQQLAESLGIPFLETSAKEDTNITEAFDILTEKILESKAPPPVTTDSKSGCIVM